MNKQNSQRQVSNDPPVTRPLGRVLRKAGLVSRAQVYLALEDQKNFPNLLLGEIMVLRGWLKQETVDFFVKQWPKIVKIGAVQPIGHYFRAAGLLDEQQIEVILKEQIHIGLRFGSVAVLKEWVKQTTLDFFLEHLAPDAKNYSPFVGKQVKVVNEKNLYIGQASITVPDATLHNHHDKKPLSDPHNHKKTNQTNVDALPEWGQIKSQLPAKSEEDFDLSEAIDSSLTWLNSLPRKHSQTKKHR